MKTQSKKHQINWWLQQERNIQLKQSSEWHIMETQVTNEELVPRSSSSLQSVEEPQVIVQTDGQAIQDDSLLSALEQHWITDDKIAEKLSDIMDNAYTSTPEWDLIPDYKTQLDTIKVYLKIKKKLPSNQINIANIFWGKDNIF